MTDQAPESESERWQRESEEELRVAEVMAAHVEIPDRVAGFHAHLAAEKALKALLVRRGVPMPRIHDLFGLHRLLPVDDQGRFDEADLELLNPWTIEGRYPADTGELGRDELDDVLAAAKRVTDTARQRDGT